MSDDPTETYFRHLSDDAHGYIRLAYRVGFVFAAVILAAMIAVAITLTHVWSAS